MYVGAVVQGMGFLGVFGAVDEARDRARESNRTLDPGEIDSVVSWVIAFVVIVNLAIVALWIWMAVKNSQGRNWARGTATVFGAMGIVMTALGGGETDLTTIIEVINSGVTVVILVLLWQPESTRYFEQMGSGCSTPPS